MPGIAGVISKRGFVPAVASRMIATMRHEPFYVSGAFANDAIGISIAWTAHPGSYCAEMPLWNERADACLIFTGENFLDADDVERLAPRASRQAGSRAQELMALYDVLGPGFIEKLNGWFSGVLVDIRNKSAILFNDRYGLGRIYVHEAQDRLLFASEAKALLEVAPSLRQLDFGSVAESVACGAALRNKTLFAGVSLLPPGSMWTLRPLSAIDKRTYFDKSVWQSQSPLGAAQFDEALRETFVRVLPKYFSGQPLAMSLTGGLDGRMIMAWAGARGALPCYTFGGPFRTCADVAIARRIAALRGQTHQTINVDDAFLRDFPTLADKAVYISDGAMDVTGAVELYVNNIARRIAPVRMTGNYGSEIVRANIAFRPGRFTNSILCGELAQAVVTAGETYNKERDVSALSFIAFKQTPWHHYARLAVEQSQLTLRSPFLDNEIVALMFRAPPERLMSKDPSMKLIAEGDARLALLPTDRGEVFCDRSPFAKLRERFADFMIKAEYAYDYGMPQRLAQIDYRLRRLHLEKAFLGRHKFYHFRVWYRDALADFVKDILLDPRALGRPYLNGKEVERVVLAHTRGQENWTREIHRLLSLELLQRRMIDR